MNPEFIIILSDTSPHYTEQGKFLPDFLRIFHQSIRTLTLKDLEQEEAMTCSYLFIAMPNSINTSLLTKIKHRHLYLYDFHDQIDYVWGESPLTDYFKQHCEGYFKAHRLRKQTADIPIKLLPIPLKNIPWFARLKAIPLSLRPINLFFMGVATRLPTPSVVNYNQRFDWVCEAKDRHHLVGGLIDHPKYPINQLTNDTSIQKLISKKKGMDTMIYFLLMALSKISLLPCGNGRWTYRHYEALLTSTIPLSNDLSGIELFIPITEEHYIFVLDHQTISPYVDEILSTLAIHQERVIRNKFFILKYVLPSGKYHASKPLPLKLFLDQLNPQ